MGQKIDYKFIADTTYDWEYFISPNGKMLYCSPSCERITGYSKEEFYLNPQLINDIVWSEDKTIYESTLKRNDKTEFANEVEFRIITKKRAIVWIANVCREVFDENGQLLGLRGSNRNRTEPKYIEEKHLESESLYQDLVETSQDLIWQCDSEGRYIFLNPAWEQIFGYKVDEMLGKKFVDFQTPERAELDMKKFARLLQGNTVKGLETEHISKSGNIIHLVFNAKFITDEDSNIVGTRGTAYDITEQKQTENAHRESELKYHKLYNLIRIMSDTMPDMLWAKDLNNRYIFTNRAMCENLLSAKDTTEPIGKTDLFFANRERSSHPDNPHWHTFGELCVDSDEITLKKMKKTQFDEFGNVKGKFLYLDVHKAPLFNNEGELIGVVGSARNITERKQAEKQIRESQILLKSSVESPKNMIILSIDLNYKYLYFNTSYKETMFRAYGKYVEVGMNLLDCITDDQDKTKSKINYDRALAGESHISIEEYGDIERLHYETRYGPILNDNNKVIGATAFSSNITERVRAEKELVASETRFRQLAESIQETFWLRDAKTDNIIYVSPAYETMFGKTCESLYTDSQSFLNNIHPEDVERVIKEQHKMKKSGKAFEEEFRILMPGGVIHWIKSRTFPILDKENVISRYAGIAEDITEEKKAEELIKASEEKYKIFFEADLAGDYRVSANGSLLDCNKAFLKIYEYDSKEEALAANMIDLYPNKSNRAAIFKKLKNESRLDLIECKLRTNKGREIFVIESMLAEYDGKGKFIAATGFVIDVTDIKIAEQAVKESENKYRELFNRMENGFAYHEVILNKKGKPVDYRFLVVNKAYEKMTGLISDNITGKSVLEVLPDTKKDWIDIFGRVALTRKPVKLENYSKESGKYYRILAYSPEKMRFACLTEDITESKKTEEKIGQLSIAVEQSPVAVGITDLKGNLIYVNPKFVKSTGYTAKELIGQNPRILKSGYTKQADYVKMWKTISSGKDWSGVFRNKKKNGELFWESANISPLRDSKGNITHYVGVKEDITEKVEVETELEIYRNNLESLVELRTNELDSTNKRLQEEIRKEKEYELILRDALSKEQELSELKTRFISTASHEFRTPLTAILLSTGLIQRYSKKWPVEKFEEHVDRIKSSIQYLAKLLDDVLTINKTDSGKIAFDPKMVDLPAFCNEMIKEVSGYVKDNHHFEFIYEPVRKKFLLDAKLLKFILSNLLSNAFKYSPNGGNVIFYVSSTNKDIAFKISDQGMGIPENDRSHLFEPFHRGSNSIEIQGTGLGLSIVKRAANLHNGDIFFVSELNVGTTFIVNIPHNDKKEIGWE